MQIDRRKFYEINLIVEDVKKKVKDADKKGEDIDYLSFVPDGEPTLDINLGREIALLKPLGIKIAVITNASLLWNEDVRNDLMEADWVSLKIDSLDEKIWRKVNRPHKFLKFESIIEGMLQFANDFNHELATETMLLKGINDSKEEIEKVAKYLEELKPDKSYVAIPTRPPAEKYVKPANEQVINMAYQIFSENLRDVEYLIGYEGNAFAFTGDVEEDLLSITAVHPMREEGVNEFLSKAKSDWSVIEKLIEKGELIETTYQGNKFYIRSFSNKQ